MSPILLSLLLPLLLLLNVSVTDATVRRVPQDYPTIEMAFAAVAEHDSVVLAAGVYPERWLELDTSITLVGNPAHPDSVVIDGDNWGRILHCSGSGTYSIIGITFIRGITNPEEAQMGGAILSNYNLEMRIRDCRFIDCESLSGGALAILSGNALVQGCRFEGNTGSALYSQSAQLELYSSQFIGNHGPDGGALRMSGGGVLLDDCRFTGNTADNRGGAILGRILTGQFCEFVGNSAPLGRDIHCYQLFFYRSAFAGGRVGQGPAILWSATAEIRNSILYGSNGQSALACDPVYDFSTVFVECSTVYQLDGSPWTDQENTADAGTVLFADPLFCDQSRGNLGLADGSPCLPGASPCGSPMGVTAEPECGLARPMADFHTVNSLPLTGEEVEFHNASSTWATRLAWDLDGDGVTDSQEDDPRWTYNQPGDYTVTLIASNGALSDTLSVPRCIRVHAPLTLRIPEDYPTIEAAQAACGRGDTLSVACGTWQMNRFNVPRGVSLIGRGNDPECVTLDAGGSSRVLELTGLDSTSLFSGLRFTGGLATGGGIDGFGGAIWMDTSSPVFRNCIFTGNEANHGGAAGWAWGSSPVFEECTFAGNTGHIWGSAVYSGAPQARLRNCILQANGPASAVSGDLGITCSDIHGNPGGDWTGSIADLEGVDGNFNLDALFCADPEGLYRLEPESPCFNPECGVIGANPRDCLGTGVETVATPQSMLLLACYPNPFNAMLRIRITTTDPGPLRLRVYDIRGGCVFDWAGSAAGPGETGLLFHGDGLASGLYLVQLESPTASDVQKVLLVK